MNRSKVEHSWKIWLGLGVVFISGLGIGVAGTMFGVHHHIRSLVEGGPAAFNRMVTSHISSQLDLTEEQENMMYEIVTKTHEELWNFKTQHDDKIAEIIQNGFDEMNAHLSPDKQQALKELFDKHHKMLKSHEKPDQEHKKP